MMGTLPIPAHIENIFSDFRHSCRSLFRAPGFTLVAVATLGMAIAASLTMLGLLRAVLWRPLPYPEADRIVAIQVDARNVSNIGATAGEVFDLNRLSHSLELVSTIDQSDANLEVNGESEHLEAAAVSDHFLPLLGVRPALGRLLDSRVDESRDQALSVLISDSLWRRRFHADSAIAGRTVLVNNATVQIVGVLPPGFRLYLPPALSAAEDIDIWFPASLNPERRYRGVPIAARVKGGFTLDGVNGELQSIAAQFERDYPDFYSGNKGWQAAPSDSGHGRLLRFSARPLQEDMTREVRRALFLLSAAVGFVFLIACVNVANLMLARASRLERELAIRRALGAARLRILRPLFIESLLLGLISAVAGLIGAHFGLMIIAQQNATHIPLQSRIGVDGTLALMAVGLALTASVLFGVLPAWRIAFGLSGDALHAGRTGTAPYAARRLQRLLIVCEVALSIAPLVCGGLMLRSFVNLLHAPLGFDAAHVVAFQVPFDVARYPQAADRFALLRSVIERLRAIPGVEAASAGGPLPLAGQSSRRVGRADQPDAAPILATQQGAAPGYLAVMGTPLLAGRDFTDADVAHGMTAAIIDERLAKRFWPEGAIGKRLTVYRTGWRHELEVIGVTRAVRLTRVRDDSVPNFILPNEYPDSLVVRSGQPIEKLAPLIQAAVAAAHTGRAAFDIRSMQSYVSDSIGDTRFMLMVLGAFGVAAVMLTAVGLYGTLAYLTLQRTREFGIRMALGASVRGIAGIVLRESMVLSLSGIGAGFVVMLAVSRGMRHLLFGVGVWDGVTFGGVAFGVGLLALMAGGLPAWRASRIDPQRSLRSE